MSRRRRALTGLALAVPALAAATAAIKLEDGGAVFYRQARVGKDGVAFELLKLQTMVVGAERQGAGVASGAGIRASPAPRRVLRRLSLDELRRRFGGVYVALLRSEHARARPCLDLDNRAE